MASLQGGWIEKGGEALKKEFPTLGHLSSQPLHTVFSCVPQTCPAAGNDLSGLTHLIFGCAHRLDLSVKSVAFYYVIDNSMLM